MLKLIPMIAAYASALGFFGNALHQLVNGKDPAAAMDSFLKGLAAAGFGGMLHVNTATTIATAAKADVITAKTTDIQDATTAIASTTNAISRKV